MSKVFCVYCEGETNYSVKEVLKEFVVKDVKVKELVKEAYCDKCGQKVFVYDIEKSNQQIVYNAYKKKVGLLTSNQIIAIRQKYGLSQRKLAKIIHCGEKNIARYENCGIQDKTIDLLIVMLDEHPEYFGIQRVARFSSNNWIKLNSSYREKKEKQRINTNLQGKGTVLKGVGCNA